MYLAAQVKQPQSFFLLSAIGVTSAFFPPHWSSLFEPVSLGRGMTLGENDLPRRSRSSVQDPGRELRIMLLFMGRHELHGPRTRCREPTFGVRPFGPRWSPTACGLALQSPTGGGVGGGGKAITENRLLDALVVICDFLSRVTCCPRLNPAGSIERSSRPLPIDRSIDCTHASMHPCILGPRMPGSMRDTGFDRRARGNFSERGSECTSERCRVGG